MTNVIKVASRGTLFQSDTIPGCRTNIYLIDAPCRSYIIDTGFGSDSIEIINPYMDKNKPVIIINTHHHWDHIWGNAAIQNSPIIAHKNCKEVMNKKWDEMLEHNKKYICGSIEKCLPNLLLDSELYFPEDGIRIFHTPGHTIDSISIYDEIDKVLAAGDNIGDNMDEIIPSLYCEKEYLRKTLDEYEQIDFNYCVSGHNEVLGKDIIKHMKQLL